MALVNVAGATEHIEDDREERAEEDDKRDAGFRRWPENDCRRNPGERRNRPHDFERRKHEVARETVLGHGEAEREADQLSHRKTKKDASEARCPVVPELAVTHDLVECAENLARRWHGSEEGNAKTPTQLPQCQQSNDRDDTPQSRRAEHGLA